MTIKERHQAVSLILASIGLAIGIALLVVLRDPALASMYRTFVLLDVFDETPNKTAIEYLYQNNVVEGYKDHTFHPERTLNRAEFTTLIAKSEKVDLRDYKSQCFPDTEISEWFHPYVCAAKERDWVQGYPDGSFKPGNKINKVEALSILCRAQNWQTSAPSIQPFSDTPIDQWYTPCISYALSKNFLEEKAESSFNPSEQITRGAFSEILFRSLITLANQGNSYKEDFAKALEEIDENTELEVADTPRTVKSEEIEIKGENGQANEFKTYNVDFFENIILREPVPNIFYKNEIYILEGHIQNNTYRKAFAFLNANGEHQNFVDEKVEDNMFHIPLQFKNTGNYSLGIIPGDSGASRLMEISVIESPPSPEGEAKAVTPVHIELNHQNDLTSVSWDKGENDIVKITFSQDGKSENYFSRQDYSEYKLPYKNFENFRDGNVKIAIQGARIIEKMPLRIYSSWSDEKYINTKIATHYEEKIKEENINVDSYTNIKSGIGEITLTGITKRVTSGDAYIIKKDGFVEKIPLETSNKQNGDIPANATFILKYSPKTTGTYIIEINDNEGGAIFNVPFYVGNGIPLIPSFFDLYQVSLNQTPVSLTKDRTEMLNLINQDRSKFGLNSVILGEDLNTFAQMHSDDMATNNFFGHYNLSGESPDDRRKRIGLQTGVGENLAKSPNLLFAEEGLMLSAVHRDNILNDKWTRVGIGITKDNEGYMLVTQEFSTDTLGENDLQGIKEEFLVNINEKRNEQSLSPIGIDDSLNNLAEEWSREMAADDFFGFENSEGNKLLDRIRALQLPKEVQAFILEGNDIDSLKEEIVNQTPILEEKWRFAGIGLSITNLGILKITLLYTT